MRKPQQLKRMFEDLRPALGGLLRARRGGVVAALVAAAGRAGGLEADVASAMWHALGGAAGAGAGSAPLVALLTMDTVSTLAPGDSARCGRERCSGRCLPLVAGGGVFDRWWCCGVEAAGATAGIW